MARELERRVARLREQLGNPADDADRQLNQALDTLSFAELQEVRRLLEEAKRCEDDDPGGDALANAEALVNAWCLDHHIPALVGKQARR